MEDKERPIKGNTYSIKVELCNNDTDNKSSSDKQNSNNQVILIFRRKSILEH